MVLLFLLTHHLNHLSSFRGALYFEQLENNFVAAVSEHASWGYFDYRRKGEDFNEGFQSVPTDWTIKSERKRGFFQLLSRIIEYEDQTPILNSK
jgi:hypothetical protein